METNSVQNEGQQVMLGGQQLQVLQMNQPAHVIQGSNGQQVMVHAVQPGATTLQMAPGGQGLQLVPVSSLQGLTAGNNNPNGQQMVSIGGQQAQLIQGSDGQTYIYQPTMVENPTTVIHHPTVININGSIIQLGTQATPIQQPPQQSIINGNNILMMVGGNGATTAGTTTTTSGQTTVSNIETPDEEPLLYVNARQYRRILQRRQARAKLIDLGKIPKERPKYLHESRHRHAMNRVRGEGGRFHSNIDEKAGKNCDDVPPHEST